MKIKDSPVRFLSMTLYSFIGCALTAYGPPAALFTITIASDPVKIIILILSAFFWLLSLLLSSILWKIVGSFTVRNHLYPTIIY